jgi:hypothetical protein
MINAQPKKPESCQPGYERTYHIGWNANLDRCDVIDGGLGAFRM